MKKMYDFGVLGKWSLSTLKENARTVIGFNFTATGCDVQIIEREYARLKPKINRKEKIATVGDVIDIFNQLVEEKKIKEQYYVYRDIMNEMFMLDLEKEKENK